MSLKKRICLSLFGIGLIFFPSYVYVAPEFKEIESGLVSRTEDRIYKYKPQIDRWLTSSYSFGEISKIYQIGSLLLIQVEDSKYLYYSKNGLTWNSLDLKLSSEFRVIQAKDIIYIIEPNKITYIYESASFNSIETIEKNILENFYLSKNNLYYLEFKSNVLSVFLVTELGLVLDRYIDSCQLKTVFTKPFGILCLDKTFWLKNTVWERFNDVIKVEQDQKLLAVLYSSNNKSVINVINKKIIETTDRLINLSIKGERLFVSDIDHRWYEIDLINDTSDNLNLSGEISLVNYQSNIWLIQNNLCLFSNHFGFYSSCNLTAHPEIFRFENLFYAWWRDSSRMMSSADGINFVEVSFSWARNARLQTVFLYEDQFFAWVLNSSGRLNLHRLDTIESRFKRVTFSSKVTQSGLIADVRRLASGEQVELEGYIGVLPGQISPHFGYLHDDTGGIQFYLRDLVKEINLPRFSKIRLVGEISSSQVKRVVISSVASIEDLGYVTSDNFLISPTDLSSSLGRLVELSGEILSREKTNFVLSQPFGLLTIRGSDFNFLFPKDIVTIQGVIDYNQASENNELYFLSLEYRSNLNQEPNSLVTNNSSVNRQPSSPKTQPNVVQAKNDNPASLSLVRSVAVNKSESVQPEIDNNRKTNENLNLTLVPLALVAGFLSAKGRRFKR